jgi:putative ABC transport system permease protein
LQESIADRRSPIDDKVIPMRDIRLAIRSLAHSPRFTLAALLALALGIGAATTVFSVADGLLFRPLPYREPDRLVAVMAAIRTRGFLNWDVPAADFDAWRTATPALADLAGHRSMARLTLMVPGDPEEVAVAAVTPNFLRVLGVPPARGREFTADEFLPGASPALMLTDATWRRVFQADPNAIGRPLTVNGVPGYVVGVLPRTFAFPVGSAHRMTDVLMPLAQSAAGPQVRLTLIGRLAPGATTERAAVDLDRFAKAHGGDPGLRNAVIDGAEVQPLVATLIASTRANLMVLLLGAVGALLLIGCANVGNLLVARGTDRGGELTLRAALGASRAALVRLQLTEVAVLAVCGAALGVGLSYWAIAVLNPLVPDDLKLLKELAVDGRALGFAAGTSMLALLVCGLLPALRVAPAGVGPTLNWSASRSVSGRLGARQIVVGFEVALAVVLLVGGALMTNAMIRLLGIDHGYQTGHVLTMRVQLPRLGPPPRRSTTFVEQVLTAARATPGVVAAGASERSPLEWTLYGGVYKVEGFSDDLMRQGAPAGGPCCTTQPVVSSDYFSALGVQVLRGRAFTRDDAAGAPRVALINEKLARKFPPNVDPVGQYLVNYDKPEDRRQIVGVVHDSRDMRLEDQPMQAIYLPLEETGAAEMTLMLRTSGPPLSIAPAVRGALRTAAGPVVVSNVRTFDELLMRSASERRLNAWLFGSFGVLGLLLAATGIYGVISYAVARRTREMGVRLALGATPAGVRRLVIAQTFVPVAAGLAVGLAASLALSRYIASLLYEVPARDVVTYVVVCVILSAAALAAAYLPARRASRVDPMIALRAE